MDDDNYGSRRAEEGPTPPGTIRHAFVWNITCTNVATCGGSNSSLDAGPVWDYRDAEATFRSWGWRRRKKGWVCPECVGE